MEKDKVADAIVIAADGWMKWHEEKWGGGADPSMVEAGKLDAADLRHVASLVRENKLTAARTSAANLDTIVRDELPQTFFQLLEDNGVEW
jgi:hypothetical protein